MPEIVSRDRWGSVSRWKFGNMKLPARNVFLHHTVTTPTDFPYQDAKQIEKIGISRFGQISYSYLVHPNGTILEGAGTKTGAHTANQNSTSFGIALIGTFTVEVPGVPTGEQIEAVRWLVYYLKEEKNWLIDSAVLTPHRAVSATECPGDDTVAILDQFREPWTPPQPPAPVPVPPFVIGTPVEINMNIAPITVVINLDSNGNGWTKIPYPAHKVMSVIPHSGTRPGADGFYDGVPDQVGITPEDEGTIIVVRGGNPGGTAPVWVQVVTE